MKNNLNLIISFIVGMIMYLIGFLWINTICRIIMTLGGVILSITLFVLGKRIKHTKRGVGYFSIIFSVLLLFALIFVTIGSIASNF